MINLLEKFFIRLKIIFSSILEPYSNLYWSQEGEDILIKRIFANKKNGFYVDVGLITLVDFPILISFIKRIIGME